MSCVLDRKSVWQKRRNVYLDDPDCVEYRVPFMAGQLRARMPLVGCGVLEVVVEAVVEVVVEVVVGGVDALFGDVVEDPAGVEEVDGGASPDVSALFRAAWVPPTAPPTTAPTTSITAINTRSARTGLRPHHRFAGG